MTTTARSETWGEILADVKAGNGRVMLIDGSAGSGKTRAIGQLLSSARSRGARVLLARCGADEQAVPLSMVHQLFDAAPGGDTTSGEPADCAAIAAERPGERARIFRHHFQTVKTLADRARAGHGLLAIAVDDAHLADQASLEWLGYLARRIDHRPVLLALTWSAHEPTAAGRAIATLAAHPAANRTKLAPFSPGSVRRLVNRSMNGQAADEFIKLLHRLTGGNPQITAELVSSLAAQSVQPTMAFASVVEATLGEVLFDTVAFRLHRQPVTVLGVAHAIAVLNGRFESDLVAEIARTTLCEVEVCIAKLRGLQVLGDTEEEPRFTHPAARSAVVEMHTTKDRAAAHARAAHTLYRRGAPDREVAWQLTQTLPLGESWAGEVLHSASLACIADGEGPTAERLLHRALQEPLSEARRIEFLLELGTIRAAAGNPGNAHRLLDETYQLASSPLQRASVIGRLGYLMHSAGRDCQMNKGLERSIAELTAMDGSAPREVRLTLQAQQVFHALACPSVAQHALSQLTEASCFPGRTKAEQELLAASVLFVRARWP
jgi:hypothetical protein